MLSLLGVRPLVPDRAALLRKRLWAVRARVGFGVGVQPLVVKQIGRANETLRAETGKLNDNLLILNCRQIY